MVDLQEHRVEIEEMVDRVLVKMSSVRCDCHRLISRLDPVSDRVGRIMVDGNGLIVRSPRENSVSGRIGCSSSSGIRRGL